MSRRDRKKDKPSKPVFCFSASPEQLESKSMPSSCVSVSSKKKIFGHSLIDMLKHYMRRRRGRLTARRFMYTYENKAKLRRTALRLLPKQEEDNCRSKLRFAQNKVHFLPIRLFIELLTKERHCE